MAIADDLKRFRLGGLDTDSSPEDVAINDYIDAKNLRSTGTSQQEAGYSTNIESNTLLAGMLLAGINGCNGGGAFEDIRQAAIFRTNSAGKNQILLYDYDSQSYTPIYTDVTDSGGATLLPLDPANWVNCILVNKTYLIWAANNLEVGYTNLQTLASGGYGTVLAEDLSLLKPQCMIPPTGVYGSDGGQPANYLYSKLPQFIVQYVNADFNYSAWSTRSKRFVPYQQDTPTLGSDVSQNNYIIVSVNIGSIRATNINIACQFEDTGNFSIVKTVTRAYVTALPNTTVNVDTEIYEAYDPTTNLYSFAFYNNDVVIPVASTETDLPYDYIWPSNEPALINGNLAAIADFKTLYPRPATSVTIGASGYNPNIAIPAGTFPDPLTMTNIFLGASGSGAGDHKRIMTFTLSGTPHTGDTIVIIVADIRNASSTMNHSYVVPSSEDGDLAAVVISIYEQLPSAHYVLNGDGSYTLTWTDAPYFSGQIFSVELFFAGASVANSIPTAIDNTTYQTARRYRDGKARYFPLDTSNNDIVSTPSYAQVLGNAIQLTWKINNPVAPIGAVDYQWMITVAPINKILDTTAVILNYKGSWDAFGNHPTLAINTGNIGDTYQITAPCAPGDTAHYTNLGNNAPYNTGDYVTNIGGTSGGVGAGQSYAVLPKNFGNLAGTGGILVFSLNSLALLNSEYSDENVDTNLVYDFAAGDRCTLHYWVGFAGAIESFTIVPGSGYTDGVYPGVALTGGTGSGAIATVTVSGGVVTAVTITNPGTGYAVTDSLTGTVTGGTGWSITVNTLASTGNNYFNDPCIDLSVLGYDAGTYLLKVENSSALTYTDGNIFYNGQQINVRNIFLRIYSPAPVLEITEDTVWYEIGERFTITNGLHDVLSGVITDGGGYYKTRQFPDAIQPYANPPINVLATDLNYSDFYPSAFWSKGRPGTYYDELEKTERKASIITSQQYILGSRVNGLNRFYPANIYGDGNGQTSSSQGAIQIMWQRGDVLVVIQERNVFYIPVNYAYTVLNDEITGQSISEKLFNNGRYSTRNIGIGTSKESFCTRYNTGFFVSPLDSQPMEITLSDVQPISGKMSKYFKAMIQAAYAVGKRLHMYYDTFYEEVVFCVQSSSGIIKLFPFDNADWDPNDSYIIAPAGITANNGSHSTVAYNSGTGIAVYTPTTNYVGNDVATFSFDPGSGTITKNVCLNWTAGSGSVDPFSFAPLIGVPISTSESSNTIAVGGNDYPVAISITGDTGLGYSINGGSFTSSPGTVNAGDSVQVRVTSSASNTTATSCTLTIDGQSATFTVTTAAAGNFIASAGNYGMTIDSVLPSTGGSGIPSGYAPCNLAPGTAKAAAYTTLTAGSYIMVLDGTPLIPGHVYAVLSVNGVVVSQQLVTGAGEYFLNLAVAANDPDLVIFETITES